MIPFSRSILLPLAVEYLPATRSIGPEGGTRTDLPSSGTFLDASVQVGMVRRIQPDGQVYTVAGYHVYTDDTSSLNGGVGVRVDDVFRWQGLLLQCQSRSTNQGGVGAIWMTECLEVT